MTSWTPEQLGAIGAVNELDIAAFGSDGALRSYTTIWVVQVGDGLYVRSYRGQAGIWYRAVQRRPEGRIRVDGVERDTTFEHPADVDQNAIDAAYRSKYGRYGRSYLDPMLAPGGRGTTLRLNPA
jgi:hypothetical protein